MGFVTWYHHPNGQRAVCPHCGQTNLFDNRDRKVNPRAPDIRCGTCERVATVFPDGSWRWWTEDRTTTRRRS